MEACDTITSGFKTHRLHKCLQNHAKAFMGKTGKPFKLGYSPGELVGIRAIRTESRSHFKAVGTNESCWRSLQ